MADARTAYFDNILRRTIIELAITCEIVVKRKFFPNDTPAGSAFDYISEKSKVTVTVLDLISNVAQEAFGEAFREKELKAFKDIDHLFRCRNKAAHRGALSYRDDKGIKTQVNSETVKEWFQSVETLLDWLNKLGHL